jgi:hypothetical protein
MLCVDREGGGAEKMEMNVNPKSQLSFIKVHDASKTVSYMYTMQAGLCESTHRDTCKDISSKSHNTVTTCFKVQLVKLPG